MTTTFAIIGSGRRADFFLRLAAKVPDRLRVAGVISRSRDRGDALSAKWRIPAFSSIDELLNLETPDYFTALVPRTAMPDVVRTGVERGLHVLAETPPAPDTDSLRALWSDVGSTGLVGVSEQYRLMPTHAARLAIVRDGAIGTPTSVRISSTHLYHAVSLIRGYLAVGFERATVSARSFTAAFPNPLGFDGWSLDADPQQLSTTIATIDFDGTMGLYDFTDNQWWNPLLSRRLVVRGTGGELADDTVLRLVDPQTPVESRLIRRQTGIDLDLEHLDLRHISFDGKVVYRNPFAGASMSDDDIAVADHLERTGAWARGDGAVPYSLAEACQDQSVSLAIAESMRSNGPILTSVEPWAL